MNTNICRVTKESDIDEIVSENTHKLIFIMVGARNCQNSMVMRKEFIHLSKENDDIMFIFVDMTDFVRNDKTKYLKDVQELPSFIYIVGNNQVAFVGPMDKLNEQLKKAIQTLMVVKERIDSTKRDLLEQENKKNIVERKVELLNMFREFQNNGIQLSKYYNLDSNLNEMIIEYKNIVTKLQNQEQQMPQQQMPQQQMPQQQMPQQQMDQQQMPQQQMPQQQMPHQQMPQQQMPQQQLQNDDIKDNNSDISDNLNNTIQQDEQNKHLTLIKEQQTQLAEQQAQLEAQRYLFEQQKAQLKLEFEQQQEALRQLKLQQNIQGQSISQTQNQTQQNEHVYQDNHINQDRQFHQDNQVNQEVVNNVNSKNSNKSDKVKQIEKLNMLNKHMQNENLNKLMYIKKIQEMKIKEEKY